MKTLKVGDADAQAAVTQRSGITGEKMELDGYCFLDGDNIEVYDHMNKHTLFTMVQLNENNEEAGHKVAMPVSYTHLFLVPCRRFRGQLCVISHRTECCRS